MCVLRLSRSSGTSKDSDAICSDAALAHGELRYRQGYTPAMLVHESRILQVTILRDVAEQSEFSGFQLVITRRHDDRGRGGCPVDTTNGQLHESHAESSGSLAAYRIRRRNRERPGGKPGTPIAELGYISEGRRRSIDTCFLSFRSCSPKLQKFPASDQC
jgi:hypothetical protein